MLRVRQKLFRCQTGLGAIVIIVPYRHRFAALLVGAAVAGAIVPDADAQGISRVEASRLSCVALKQIVRDEGAVIVRSRSPLTGNRLSDRYVSRRGFCFEGEVTRHNPVATRDTDRCSLKLCVDNPYRRNNR